MRIAQYDSRARQWLFRPASRERLMANRPLDIAGKRFGKLIVLRRAGYAGGKSTWECKCDCGNYGNYIHDSLA